MKRIAAALGIPAGLCLLILLGFPAAAPLLAQQCPQGYTPSGGRCVVTAAGAAGFTAGAGTLTGPAVNGVALIDTPYKALATGPLCNTTSTGVPFSCNGALDTSWYGAVCDGTTDDTTALRNAVAAAISQKRALHIQTSTNGCLLAAPITVDNAVGVHWFGDSPSASRIFIKPSTFAWGAAAFNFTNPLTDALFENFGVYTNNSITGSGGTAIFFIQNGVNDILRNVTLTSGAGGGTSQLSGIIVNSSNKVYLESVRAYNFNVGLSVSSSYNFLAVDSIFSNNYIEMATGNETVNGVGGDLTFISCYFDESGTRVQGLGALDTVTFLSSKINGTSSGTALLLVSNAAGSKVALLDSYVGPWFSGTTNGSGMSSLSGDATTVRALNSQFSSTGTGKPTVIASGSSAKLFYDNVSFVGSRDETNAALVVNRNTNAGGDIQQSTYNTVSNCSSAAAPAVCGSAAAGSVNVAAAATTVTVNTSAVTANSQITVTFDASLGTKLGVTCNTTPVQPTVSARSAGTSFTLLVPSAPSANPACFSYLIVN